MTDAAFDTVPWQRATIGAVTPLTPRVKSVRFSNFDGPHRAGQYVDIRIGGSDGHEARRSFSIASAPGDPKGLELIIETFDDGSSFFEVGKAVELRGPIGGSFVWGAQDGGPVLLLGGGTGVVPLLAMLRTRAAARSETPMLLIYSARNRAEVIAREELEARSRDETGFDLTLITTQEGATAGRRVDRVMIETALDHLGTPRHVFVSGGNGFVGSICDLLTEAKVKPGIISAERFGG